jgi:hypothetical protein
MWTPDGSLGHPDPNSENIGGAGALFVQAAATNAKARSKWRVAIGLDRS